MPNPWSVEQAKHGNAKCFTCKSRIRKGEMMVHWGADGCEHYSCSMNKGWLKGWSEGSAGIAPSIASVHIRTK